VEEASFAMARVRALAEAECFPSLGQGEVRSEWIARWGSRCEGIGEGERDRERGIGFGVVYICLLCLFLTVGS
jgi:hypothetical protein